MRKREPKEEIHLVELIENDSTDDEAQCWIQFKKQGDIKTVSIFIGTYTSYIFHRVVRIWPGVFLTVVFFTGPARLLLSGPLRAAYEQFYLPRCRANWWWDLTFITNALMRVSHARGTHQGPCLENSWYLSVDMQIYLAMPFLILPIKLIKRKQLYIWSLITISCLIPTLIIMLQDLPPTGMFSIRGYSEGTSDYPTKIYYMPWARSTPYFVGALCALWLALFEKSGKTGKELLTAFYKKHPSLAALHPRALGWVVVTAVALAVVLGLKASNYTALFSNSSEVPPPHVLSEAETFFYASLVILAWSAVVAWVVMLCALGLAEPLNFFMSHPMWQPLSRLSFGVYLVSLPLQTLIFATLQEFMFVNYNMMFLLWSGIVVLSFMGSLLLSLLAESPVINLLKLMSK